MNIKSLFEVIVYCQDMHAQVTFYRDVLGLTVSYPEGLDDYGDQHWVTFETGPCTLALHSGGTDSAVSAAPKFVFQVDEVMAAREELLEAGVRVSDVREPAPGVRVFDGVDPEGNTFSIESQ